MEQRYQNDVDMFGVVRDYLTTHAAQLTAVPIIATLATELGQKIAALHTADAVVVAPITGIAADKDELRTDVEEAAFAISEPLASYALAAGNLTLRDEVDETRSGLDKMDAAVLDAFAERVAARGTMHLASLTPYGVTAPMITAIGTARTAFNNAVNDPRSAIVERAAQTESIPTIIRDVKTRLLRGQLDRLMNRYRLTAPTLYSGYRGARTIVNRTGGGGSGGNGGEPPEPPTGLTFTQENPGDPLIVDGTLAPEVTLVKILLKAVGSSEEPALVGSAATLPTAISGISPGEYEFTATVTTADGESDPSAPVTLTLG